MQGAIIAIGKGTAAEEPRRPGRCRREKPCAHGRYRQALREVTGW